MNLTNNLSYFELKCNLSECARIWDNKTAIPVTPVTSEHDYGENVLITPMGLLNQKASTQEH